jgi:hypothetical protein
MRVGAVGAGTASGLHVAVTDEPALAAATPCFSAATRLQVWLANKPTVARPTAADGAAIGLAVWVLNKAAVALLGECWAQ